MRRDATKKVNRAGPRGKTKTMKKIIAFSTVALSAAVACAAVESANIVGYNNITLRSGSYVCGSTFNGISLAGTRLTDLRPTGYENLAYWAGGMGGGFKEKVSVLLLTYQGKQDRKWTYTRSYDKTNKVWLDGYWFDADDSTKAAIVPGSEADFEFGTGDGLYVTVAANAYSSTTKATADQYKLINSGEAILDSNQVVLRSGSKCVVSPVSRKIRLSEIKPVGYENLAYWAGGMGGGFKEKVSVLLLTYQGKQDRKWTYTRSYDKTNKVWLGGYWFDADDSTKAPIAPGSEADFEFDLGEGLYVTVAANAYSSATKATADQYSLEFPGLYDTIE